MYSPCKKICIHDPALEMCLGCGRTLQEIQDWMTLDETEQLRIMAELPERLREHRPGKV